jgi:hypothetical protein
MNCTTCGTELHSEALRCWKCGTETPNYTEDLKTLRQKEEEERLRNTLRAENPREAAYQDAVKTYQDAVKRGSLHPLLRRILAIVFWPLAGPIIYLFWTIYYGNDLPIPKMDPLFQGLAIRWWPLWLVLTLCVGIAYVVVRIIDGDIPYYLFGDGD